MIEVRYRCRTGNRLFQYCFGRILAEELGYCLQAAPVAGFPSTAVPVGGERFARPTWPVVEQFRTRDGRVGQIPPGPGAGMRIAKADVDRILERRPRCRLLVDGFYQHFDYFAQHLGAIRERWVVPDPAVLASERHPDDLVIHVRRGDMVGLGWAAPWSYFRRVLEIVDFRRLYLVTDFPGDPFLRHFAPYAPSVLSSGVSDESRPHRVIEDFKTLMAFNKIALSSGTFGWWAALLARAEEVYVPRLEEFGLRHGSLLGDALRVPERRYRYVGATEVRRGAAQPPRRPPSAAAD